jgi:uncharacterized phage-associated protein
VNFTFNPKKSVQAGAYLLKQNGGDMDKYLWIKMLYLADRESLGRWEEPITGDSPASMQYGPVLSTIYDLTKGDCPTLHPQWEQFISDADPETNRVFLKADPGIDELSKAEVGILESVFQKFRNYTWRQMKDFCHRLTEYEEVGRSSKPLPFERILTALGKSPKEIEEAEARHVEMCVAEMLLSPR